MTAKTVFLLIPVAVGLGLTACGAVTSGELVATPSTSSSPVPTVTSLPNDSTEACTLNEDGVTISYLPGDGSVGQFHGTLVLTNPGPKACSLEGFPIVYFGNPESAGPIGARSRDGESSFGPVVLAPSSGMATASLTITDAAAVGVCDPLESSNFLVRLPGAPDIPYSEGIAWARFVPIEPLPSCLDDAIGLITVGGVVAG